MKTFKVDLYEYFGLNRCEGAEGYLTAFINEPNDFNLNRIRPAMLVIPGGGYRYNSNAESDNVAIEYLAQGYWTEPYPIALFVVYHFFFTSASASQSPCRPFRPPT